MGLLVVCFSFLQSQLAKQPPTAAGRPVVSSNKVLPIPSPVFEGCLSLNCAFK